MSTTLPESVTTQNTTTTTTRTEPAVVVPSSSGPTVVSHTGDPTSSSSSSGTSTSTTGISYEKVQAAAVTAGQAISSAAVTAGHHIAAAGTAIQQKAHEVDDKYHISNKASDMASHVGTALKHGHPGHAVKHATTAATIGEAERAKHEHGPLPEGAHAAPGIDGTTQDGETSHIASTTTTSITSKSGSTTTTTTQPTLGEKASAVASDLGAKASAAAADIKASASETGRKLSNQAADASSFASTAVSHGHPIYAAKYASTAAVIGQAERDKHSAGPLENEKDITAKVHHTS
jgi:hypothetical protein